MATVTLYNSGITLDHPDPDLLDQLYHWESDPTCTLGYPTIFQDLTRPYIAFCTLEEGEGIILTADTKQDLINEIQDYLNTWGPEYQDCDDMWGCTPFENGKFVTLGIQFGPINV